MAGCGGGGMGDPRGCIRGTEQPPVSVHVFFWTLPRVAGALVILVSILVGAALTVLAHLVLRVRTTHLGAAPRLVHERGHRHGSRAPGSQNVGNAGEGAQEEKS